MENKRLTSTLAAIDSINADDPNTTMLENSEQPNELIYGQRMSACLNSYWPEASEYLQIAVRAQHIKRWHLKRADFPAGKAGYLNWRKQLGIFHAELTKEIMIENNYSEEEGHHPDINFGWGYAKINITTHAIEGLSENDFILAAKIDQITNV